MNQTKTNNGVKICVCIFLALFLALGVGLALGFAGNVTAYAAEYNESGNMASGATMEGCCKYANGYDGSKAIDGNTDTAWAVSGAAKHAHYGILDLGTTKQFNHIQIVEDSYWHAITGFNIYVSEDKENWTKVWAYSRNYERKTVTYDVKFPMMQGRYIKIGDIVGKVPHNDNGTEGQLDYEFTLKELRVYRNDNTENLLAYASEINTTEIWSGYGIDKMYDGNVQTRWAAQGSKRETDGDGNQFVYIDIKWPQPMLVKEMLMYEAQSRNTEGYKWIVYNVDEEGNKTEIATGTFAEVDGYKKLNMNDNWWRNRISLPHAISTDHIYLALYSRGGVSLGEMVVAGEDININYMANVTANNFYNNMNDYHPMRAVDGLGYGNGSYGTRWATNDSSYAEGYVDGYTFDIDYGTEETFNTLYLNSEPNYSGKVNKVEIQTWSNDAWTTVRTIENVTKAQGVIETFEAVTATKVRLVFYGNGPTFNEIKLYYDSGRRATLDVVSCYLNKNFTVGGKAVGIDSATVELIKDGAVVETAQATVASDAWSADFTGVVDGNYTVKVKLADGGETVIVLDKKISVKDLTVLGSNVATGTASATSGTDKADNAFDGDGGTVWAETSTSGDRYVDLTLTENKDVSLIAIMESNESGSYKVAGYKLQYKATVTDEEWTDWFTGTTIGELKVIPLAKHSVTAIRLVITEAEGAVGICEMQAYDYEYPKLSDIKINGQMISGFAPETAEYNLRIARGNGTTVTATAAEGATATVKEPTAYPGTATITVTDANGVSVDYTVSIAYQNNTAALSLLTVDGEAISMFSASVETYTVTLPKGTTAVPQVSGVAADNGSVTATTQAQVVPGSATVTVTSEDGANSKTYTVNFVIAKSSDATLSSIKVDGADISGFGSNITLYTVALDADVTEMPQVSATATDAEAQVSIKQATKATGVATITVTAEDGTQQVYTVRFTQEKSSDATLASLTVGGTAVSGFSANKLEYNVELAAGTTVAPEVTATANDGKARVVVTQAASVNGTAKVEVIAEDGSSVTYTVKFSVKTESGNQDGDGDSKGKGGCGGNIASASLAGSVALLGLAAVTLVGKKRKHSQD